MRFSGECFIKCGNHHIVTHWQSRERNLGVMDLHIAIVRKFLFPCFIWLKLQIGIYQVFYVTVRSSQITIGILVNPYNPDINFLNIFMRNQCLEGLVGQVHIFALHLQRWFFNLLQKVAAIFCSRKIKILFNSAFKFCDGLFELKPRLRICKRMVSITLSYKFCCNGIGYVRKCSGAGILFLEGLQCLHIMLILPGEC